MSDFYFDLSGDILISANRDIAMANSSSQKDLQQIFIRLMTETGDFYAYPQLGCDLSMLYGMPQTQATGELGKRIIKAALEDPNKAGIFKGRNISIEAVPTSANTIRFDVHILDNSLEPVTLSVTQDL
jgi:hypothetical protein